MARRRVTVPSLLVLAAAMALAPRLSAQPGDDARAEAQARFERGVALMENENWEAALVEFERSLELHPTRSALFNAGMCRKALHRYVVALDTFRSWRQLYDAVAREEERQAVRDAEAELAGFIGTVDILVDVPGAEVRLDGAVVGTAPLGGPINVDAGRHVVEAVADGYDWSRVEIVVATLERVPVSLTLEPIPPAPPIEPPDDPPFDADPVVPPPPEEEGVDVVSSWWFWTVIGVVVAGGAVTAGVLLAPGDERAAADYTAWMR